MINATPCAVAFGGQAQAGMKCREILICVSITHGPTSISLNHARVITSFAVRQVLGNEETWIGQHDQFGRPNRRIIARLDGKGGLSGSQLTGLTPGRRDEMGREMT